MSGIVSVELVLDPETEARVRSDWQSLASAGLSSLGAHPSPSNRPHITLLARATLPATVFAGAVSLLPLSVELVEPITFIHDARAVLAWRVSPTAELCELHRAVHQAAPPGEDSPHTTPGVWTPHVSLARRLRLASLVDALDLLGPAIAGTGVALRRWDSASATVTALG